jgi:transposase
MSSTSVPYAAFVGIDRSDRSIDLTVLDSDSRSQGHRKIDSKPAALRDWLLDLRRHFPDGQLALCIEQPCANLAAFFVQYDFVDLYLINPATFKHWREAFQPSRAKTDKSDSHGIAQLVFESYRKLPVWKPDDAPTRQLRALVEARRSLVDLRTRVNNQLVAALKNYFPEALELTGKYLHAALACRFLKKWPTLQSLKKATAKSVREFYYRNGSRRPALIDRRLQVIAEAIPLTDDPAILDSSALHVKALVGQFDALRTSIDAYDREIETLLGSHEDGLIFKSLPGAGANLASRMIALFGTDRTRFQKAAAVQQYSGIAPVTKQSGKMAVVHRRYACPKFHRQTFLEWVGQTLTRSDWSRAFYDQQRDKGISHYTALRALAYKWIRIIWRCWQERKTYCEETYIEALKKHQSPLVPAILKRREKANNP